MVFALVLFGVRLHHSGPGKTHKFYVYIFVKKMNDLLFEVRNVE